MPIMQLKLLEYAEEATPPVVLISSIMTVSIVFIGIISPPLMGEDYRECE